jgi:hypothetical protein
LALLFFAVGMLQAADATVSDIITLAEKNLGEDVLLATVEASSKPFNLKADEIVKLKEGKVSDKVIAAMIRHRQPAPGARVAPAAPVAPAEPAPAQQPAPAPATPAKAEAPVIGAPAFGVLNIENLDSKVWSYRYEPDTQTIWISSSSNDGRGNLQANGGMSIRLPAGEYQVRYNGQERGQKVSVFEGAKSLLMISRVETLEVEALYVSVFERGERRASGRLVTLRENPAPREDNVIRKSSAATERVIERVVEVPRTQVVYAQPTYTYSTPTVIYAGGYSPYYSSGYCGSYYTPRYSSYNCGTRYYGNSYYGRSYYGNSYYGGGCYSGGYYRGGRSGVSVGVGFRF